jgi:hypothetical protein
MSSVQSHIIVVFFILPHKREAQQRVAVFFLLSLFCATSSPGRKKGEAGNGTRYGLLHTSLLALLLHCAPSTYHKAEERKNRNVLLRICERAPSFKYHGQNA